MSLAANQAFVAAVHGMQHHERLKDALARCLAGEFLPTSHHHAMLEGTAAPEARLTKTVEHAKSLHAEDPSALFLLVGNRELGISGMRELATLLTPPLRSQQITAHLAFIDISDNQATDFGADFEPLRNLCYQLARLSSLRWLSLHNTTLLHEGSVIVSRLLRYSRSLRFLDMSRCNVGERGAQALYAAFCHEEDYDPSDLTQDHESGKETVALAAPADMLAATGDVPTPRSRPSSGAGAGTGAARISVAGVVSGVPEGEDGVVTADEGDDLAGGAPAVPPSAGDGGGAAGAAAGIPLRPPSAGLGRAAGAGAAAAPETLPLSRRPSASLLGFDPRVAAMGGGAAAGEPLASSRPGSASVRRPSSALRSKQAAAAASAPAGAASTAALVAAPSAGTGSRPPFSGRRPSYSAHGTGGVGARTGVEASNTTLTHLDLSSNSLAGEQGVRLRAVLLRIGLRQRRACGGLLVA
jgi:hypothetical protein